jgi:quinol monooxygenase YgiN
MYGTVARVRAKPGAQSQLQQTFEDFKAAQVPGWVTTYVYRMDADPNEYYIAVLFQDKASYVANAESPEQAQRFAALMQLLEAEPEWHDGEVVGS